MTNTNELVSRRAKLLQERVLWEHDWKILAKHFLPRKCRLETEGDQTNKGGLRGGVLDSTGILAMRDLAAGLHGGMTSPARPWFKLALENHDLNKSKAARDWIDEVEKRMRAVLHRSNFYNSIHHVYGELGTFGTGFTFALPDERSIVRYLPLTVGEYCLDTDEHGRVDTVFRAVEMTLRQIMRRFEPGMIPQHLHAMFTSAANWNDRFTVVHAVYPRHDRRRDSASNKQMPYASVYYLDSSNSSSGRPAGQAQGGSAENGPAILSESGFTTFPGFGPRWDVTGMDVYGKSPGMDVLPDSVLLQQMVSSMLKALHKEIDPPMVAPEGMKGINLLPGGANFVESTGGSGQQIYPAVQIRHNIQGTQAAIMGIREQVKEGLFNNLFRMLLNSDRRQITAREIAAREEEKLILIGPVLERLHDELFIPLISRTFDLMCDAGIVPDPPEELAGMNMDIQFVSMLAQAQKMVSTSAVEQFAGFVGQSAQLFPEALDAVNPDKVVDVYAEYLGVESGIIRGQDERDEIRNARKEAEAQAQRMQQGAAGMDMMEKAGNAGSALQGLLGGMGSALEQGGGL